ncbi:MAG: lipopolysaccharide biosynthesis protein, partial [Kiritimatiellaeota bacterium]|nr:lipopolysaccharide biosynthesis protein [Kiritimatiellota bacterium]
MFGASPRFFYLLRSGHNSKFAYYARGVLREMAPAFLSRRRLGKILNAPAVLEIRERVEYYCKPKHVALPDSAPRLRDLAFPRKGSAYWFDAREYIRHFDPNLRWLYQFGDVTTVPPAPTIVKSRPVAGDNSNAVLLPLNKIRHFVFTNDKIPFAQKNDTAVFRGVVKGRGKRGALFEKHFGNPLCDLGDTSRHPVDAPEWRAPKMSISEQLRHKFILAIEGNDVASNLKWIMSSNSLAVMPPPEFETWFMEGTLVPDVHYVCVAPDFSDLDDKLRF